MADEPAPAPDGLTVLTWNIWGIPMASHAVLSRPHKAGEIAASAVLSHGIPSERTVLCFQEAWGYKTGLGQPCLALARWFEHCGCTAAPTVIFNPRHILREVVRVNSCCTLAASLVAMLTSMCFPCACLRDDSTRRSIATSLREWGLRYAVGINASESGMVSGWSKVMDSGLLIVSSVKPIASGFHAYKSTGVEHRANKGLLWMLLPPPESDAGRGGQLIVTTHQHADQPSHPNPSATRAEQRQELLRVIVGLREQYTPSLIVVCGDFNENVDSSGSTMAADLTGDPLHMVRLTHVPKHEGTCIKDDGSGAVDELDYIWAAGDDIDRLRYEPKPPLRTPHSDHSLLWVQRISQPALDAAFDVQIPSLL